MSPAALQFRVNMSKIEIFIVVVVLVSTDIYVWLWLFLFDNLAEIFSFCKNNELRKCGEAPFAAV